MAQKDFRKSCIDASKNAVLGLFLSSDSRANFVYDDIEWIKQAQEIYNDLKNSKPEKLRIMNVPE